jgi:anti-sigma-K factor RskA
MLVISVGLGIAVRSLQQRIHGLEAQLRDRQTPLAVLTAPDVRQINLVGQPSAPAASARVFWSRSHGLVLTAANLPVLPPGRVYQLWFISRGTPVSAGLLSAPDERGGLTTTISTPADIAAPDAVAVSLEPAGGVPQPTGNIYLIGQAH